MGSIFNYLSFNRVINEKAICTCTITICSVLQVQLLIGSESYP